METCAVFASVCRLHRDFVWRIQVLAFARAVPRRKGCRLFCETPPDGFRPCGETRVVRIELREQVQSRGCPARVGYAMRAAVYEKYAGGIWKLPALSDSMLYPARYKVDYAVFETHDSASSADSSRPVWVQSTLDNFGFLFAPYGSVAIAAKNADSVVYFKSKIFKQGEIRRGDWFYYVPKDSGAARVENADYDDTPDSAYLQVFTPLAGFLDTVATEMGLDTLVAYPDSLKPYVYSYAIASYFLRNFAYALHIDESRAVAEGKLGPHSDPLRIFWVTRSGYCEYYATLSVLLLRHAGIPARYVTGFAHPEVMPGRPYALFRRNSSHAWVELYSILGRWMPFDPTPPLFVVKTESPSWMTMKLEKRLVRMLFRLAF